MAIDGGVWRDDLDAKVTLIVAAQRSGMPTARLSMRRIRQFLALHFGAGPQKADGFRRKLNGTRTVDAIASEMAIGQQHRRTAEAGKRGAEAPRRTGKKARGPRL